MEIHEFSKKAWAIVACMLLAGFWVSCNNDLGSVGLNVLPNKDIIYTGENTDKNITAYTQTTGPIETDREGLYFLGCLNDPHLGKTTADFAIQFRLPYFPSFGKDPHVVSLTLRLPYHNVYGDTASTATPMKIRVYELKQDLNYDSKYYSNADLKSMTYGTNLIYNDGTANYNTDYKSFTPIERWDDRDTKQYKQIHEVAIRLSNDLGAKLIGIDSTHLLSNDSFLKIFKGLYITVDDQNSGIGSLAAFQSSLSTTSSTDTTYSRTAQLVLAYRDGTDTTTYHSYYNVSGLSASANRYVHDYSQTRFVNKINQESVVDSFIYVQPMAGLRTKIYIPGLDKWKDSTNIVINKANVTFYADPKKSSLPDLVHEKTNGLFNLNVPDSLYLLPLDQYGKTYYPRDLSRTSSDYTKNSMIYDGHFVDSTRTYTFGLTLHLQDIIDRKVENLGFMLITPSDAVEDKRVVLEGPNNIHGIKLDIVYTKYKTTPTTTQ